MEILKALQKFFKIRPSIEDLKEKHDVDGLMEALSYRSGDTQADLKFNGEIAIALGKLGDIRAIPKIEMVLKYLDDVERVWQDIKQSAPMGFQLEQERYKKEMETIRVIRPGVMQALQTLRPTKPPVTVVKNVHEDARVETASPSKKVDINKLIDDLRTKDADTASEAVQQLGMLEDADANTAVERLLDAIGNDGMRQRHQSLKDRGQWQEGDAGLMLLELTKSVLESRGLLRY